VIGEAAPAAMGETGSTIPAHGTPACALHYGMSRRSSGAGNDEARAVAGFGDNFGDTDYARL
jgi:hypothetical protein